MELTPKVFRDVQFREKARGGYHPEDVDEFLEQAALGAEVLIDRLRDASERAERAEKTASDASATDDALKRMLLMGQRTVDQAINEAREEADQLLAAARAQASSLVADAEERGRKAYEDSLAESRAKMEAASTALRQAEQEVEALRGWVDVNRSHLLAVMRDAQALIENGGLLSEPPYAKDGNVKDAYAKDVDEATVQAAGPVVAPDPSLIAGEGDLISLEEDNAPTGEWDARLLDEVGRDTSAPAPAEGFALPGAQTGQGDDADPANSLHPVTSNPGDEAGAELHTPPGDQTLAFDERALDSFFNEQDMGDERGLGRFRRRQ
jgi:DivIVA domain-containing protein